ncbi:hypothetical protein AB0333_16225 [Citricoccus sp. NPDC079358]|uniref:hypothetical protein n=1 Tax=Citricoccus sp. NPDC079358 TaxID=3154653 RepID=UPI003450CD3B
MSALLLVGAYAGPANAAPAESAVTAEQVAPAAESAPFEAQPGSLFYEVEHASSTAKKVELLEGAGFTETADLLDGLAYEKTEGGITLGYLVEPPVLVGEGKEASIDAKVGWDSRGPYMAATVNEWKKMAVEGTLYAGAGCVFITLAFGAFACAAAAVYVSSRINEIDTGNQGGTCLAMYKGAGTSFLFLPKPGAC